MVSVFLSVLSLIFGCLFKSSSDILVDTLVVLRSFYDDDGGAHVGDCCGGGHTCSSCLVDGCLMMPLEL